MNACLRCWADVHVVDELADALAANGFERGEARSKRQKARRAGQPQLHSGIATSDLDEPYELFWERLSRSIEQLRGALTKAHRGGAQLEVDLDPEFQLDAYLNTGGVYVDEIWVPPAILQEMGTLGVALRVSIYRAVFDDEDPDES